MKFAQCQAHLLNVKFLASCACLQSAISRSVQQGYPSEQTSIWKLRVEPRKFETQPQLTRETRCSGCYLHMYLALLLALDRCIRACMNGDSESEACYEKHVCSSDAS